MNDSLTIWHGLTRRKMEDATVRFLHEGRGYQSSVRLLEIDGQRAAAKDYARAPRFFRRVVAPFLLNREERALRFLHDVPGVPQVWTRVDRQCLVMELVEGTPMDRFKTGELAPEVFPRVQDVIDRIHARGVSHCDLKRRGNLILTPSGEVYLIDFAAAIIGRRLGRPFVNWLQCQMADIDDKCVPRLKKFVAPELLTPEDRAKLENPTPLEKWARKLLNR
jgi:predicted Ser/Thr protein kinase